MNYKFITYLLPIILCISFVNSYPSNMNGNLPIKINDIHSNIDKNFFNNQTNSSCSLCNDIVGIINGELHIANSTINIIENIVSHICSLIIIPIQKKECFFLLQHIQNIIDMLIEGLSPKDICIKLKFCDTKIF